MVEFHPMNAETAQRLEQMMRGETDAYLQFFRPFVKQGELTRQSQAAVKNGFFAITDGDDLVGFYSMRGLDDGYARPSFGLYVASHFSGLGLGQSALNRAIEWCRDQGIEKMMLKVDESNQAARRIYEQAGFEFEGTCPDTGHIQMELKIQPKDTGAQ